MKNWIRRFPRWIAALLITVLVMAAAVGCGSSAGSGIPENAEKQETTVETSKEAVASEGNKASQEVQASEESQASEKTSLEEIEDSEPEADEASEEEKTSAEETSGTEKTSEETETPKSDKATEPESAAEEELSVEEDGTYTSKEEVALYIHLYGKLPSNYITKKEAEALGWKQKEGEAGQLHVAAPGKSIGGNTFGNYEGLLPKKKGRKYYECDINYVEGNRGAERIIYSNDGLIYYTGDHYKTFELLYPEEGDGSEKKK